MGFRNCFGSTHVVQRLSFCMGPSVLTFDFDLVLVSSLIFWGPTGLFLSSGSELLGVVGPSVGPSVGRSVRRSLEIFDNF